MRASRRVFATRTAPSASHRPAAASLACRPDSRHRGQSKSNEVRLAEFVRRCPQSPAPSCKPFLISAFGLSNTSPFILKMIDLAHKADKLKTRVLQGFMAVLATLKTYCAEFSSGQGVQKRLQGGAL